MTLEDGKNGTHSENPKVRYWRGSRFALELISRVQNQREDISMNTLIDLLVGENFTSSNGNVIDGRHILPHGVYQLRGKRAKQYIQDSMQGLPPLTQEEEKRIEMLLRSAKTTHKPGVAKTREKQGSASPVVEASSNGDSFLVGDDDELSPHGSSYPRRRGGVHNLKNLKGGRGTHEVKAEKFNSWSDHMLAWSLLETGLRSGMSLSIISKWFSDKPLEYTTATGYKMNPDSLAIGLRKMGIDPTNLRAVHEYAQRQVAQYKKGPDQREVERLLQERIAFLKEKGITLTPLG